MITHITAPQRSTEWFDARKNRVTGSNAGAILGFDPYRGPDDVLRSMVRSFHGAESEFTGNIATQWGVANEDTAQFDYTMLTGNKAIECSFFQYDEWLGASPDGIISTKKILEIKCPFGKRNDRPVLFKTIEEQPHYYAQTQIEMLCSGRTECDFYQWTPNGEDLTTVILCEGWLGINLPILRTFYDLYLAELNNPDHLEPLRKVIDTPDAAMLASEYDDLSDSIAHAAERKKEVLEEMVRLSGGKSSLFAGRKLTKVEKEGSISYAKIVKTELPHLDLDLYRGKASTSWRFT